MCGRPINTGRSLGSVRVSRTSVTYSRDVAHGALTLSANCGESPCISHSPRVFGGSSSSESSPDRGPSQSGSALTMNRYPRLNMIMGTANQSVHVAYCPSVAATDRTMNRPINRNARAQTSPVCHFRGNQGFRGGICETWSSLHISFRSCSPHGSESCEHPSDGYWHGIRICPRANEEDGSPATLGDGLSGASVRFFDWIHSNGTRRARKVASRS